MGILSINTILLLMELPLLQLLSLRTVNWHEVGSCALYARLKLSCKDQMVRQKAHLYTRNLHGGSMDGWTICQSESSLKVI